MEENPALLFQATTSDLWTWVLLSLFAFLVLSFVAFRLGKEPASDPRRRVVLPMLLFFAALLCLMTAAGNFFSLTKYPDLAVVSPTEIRLGKQIFPFPRRDAIRMEKVSGGLGGEHLLLLLQVSNGKTYAFPEERYDVEAIWQILRKK